MLFFCCLGGGAGPAQKAKKNTTPPKQQKKMNTPPPLPSVFLFFAVWAGGRVYFFAVWAVCFFVFYCLGRWLFFCCFGGDVLFLLFGRWACFFFAVWERDVFFFAVWEGVVFFFALGGEREFTHLPVCLARLQATQQQKVQTAQKKKQKTRVARGKTLLEHLEMGKIT